MDQAHALTGNEITFPVDSIIVSKTNLKGHITYANDLFLSMAGYSEAEIQDKPHNIIRHPDMPRCVFKLLWDTVSQGDEIFAYVINRCKNGDHYWVYAHVTPSFDTQGKIISYHSVRRVPDRKVLEESIIPLYKQLLDVEQQSSDRKQGLTDSVAMVMDMLAEKGMSYEEFVLKLDEDKRRRFG